VGSHSTRHCRTGLFLTKSGGASPPPDGRSGHAASLTRPVLRAVAARVLAFDLPLGELIDQLAQQVAADGGKTFVQVHRPALCLAFHDRTYSAIYAAAPAALLSDAPSSGASMN
jgi:hypothetical protein